MTGLYVALGIIVFIGIMLWRAKKAGKDQVRAEAAEKTLETISKVNSPLSDPELERVRQKYRRD